jgi:hypothetical protein
LLSICGLPDIDAAEEVLAAFFPGDGLPDRAISLPGLIFARGLPATPQIR